MLTRGACPTPLLARPRPPKCSLVTLPSAARHQQGCAERFRATTLNNLSRVLVKQGRYDEAATALREALDIARPALGSDHPLVGIYTVNLASVHLARKEPKSAEMLLREGLLILGRAPGVIPSRRRTLPEDDWDTGGTKSLLGATLTILGRFDEAEATLLEARTDLEAMTRPPASEIQTNNARLVALYDAWHKPDRAAAYRAELMR